MRAVVDRVLPQEDREHAYRIDVLAGIDERLFENRLEGYRYADMPPDQDAYRLAARAFEAHGHEQYGQSFHALDTTRQETLLRSVHHAEPLAAKELWSQMNIKRFWTMLVADCCSVYYAHPYAWDEIGFGGPAYPRGYMRLEEGEPEPWEVDEQRYEWAAPDDSAFRREEQARWRRRTPDASRTGRYALSLHEDCHLGAPSKSLRMAPTSNALVPCRPSGFRDGVFAIGRCRLCNRWCRLGRRSIVAAARTGRIQRRRV